MKEKITTNEEYEQYLLEEKMYRDKLFNLKVDMFVNKKDPEKLKLLEEKDKILKKEYTYLLIRIREYELDNNIENKKEGKKK